MSFWKMTWSSERLRIAERGKERPAGINPTRISWKTIKRLRTCRRVSLTLRLLVDKCFDLKLRISPAIFISESMRVVMETDSHGCTAVKVRIRRFSVGIIVWYRWVWYFVRVCWSFWMFVSWVYIQFVWPFIFQLSTYLRHVKRFDSLTNFWGL